MLYKTSLLTNIFLLFVVMATPMNKLYADDQYHSHQQILQEIHYDLLALYRTSLDTNRITTTQYIYDLEKLSSRLEFVGDDVSRNLRMDVAIKELEESEIPWFCLLAISWDMRDGVVGYLHNLDSFRRGLDEYVDVACMRVILEEEQTRRYYCDDAITDFPHKKVNIISSSCIR